MQAQVQTYEQILRPWQTAIDETREKLHQIESSFGRIQGENGQTAGLFNEFQQIFSSLGE
jgi:hypothetical protein